MSESKKQQVLSGREDLSTEQFYSIFYESSGIDTRLVAELRDHVAFEMEVDPAKLRPDDRFAVELSEGKLRDWDSGYGVLLIELRRAAKEKGEKLSQAIETVDEFIREMAKVY